MGNIAGNYNSSTGVMTLTSANSSATLAQWQAALRAVAYSNSSENPNTASRTVSYVVNDGALNATAVTSTITVNSVNDQPTRNFYTISQASVEDQGAPSGAGFGQTISSLNGISGNNLDREGAAVGLAFVATIPTTYGTAWYSIDGGTTWLDLTAKLATASETNAFLLDSTARVYFQGNLNQWGGLGITTVRTWMAPTVEPLAVTKTSAPCKAQAVPTRPLHLNSTSKSPRSTMHRYWPMARPWATQKMQLPRPSTPPSR
jgi:hypothetical protein